jgi:hypothetical protein
MHSAALAAGDGSHIGGRPSRETSGGRIPSGACPNLLGEPSARASPTFTESAPPAKGAVGD